MKKSELKQLIREVIEEVEKSGDNAKQDEVEYVKAQLKAHPEIAQQIMKAFSSAQKSSKSDEKMSEGFELPFDLKYDGLMAAGFLATTPIHTISKIFNKNSTLGPDLMDKLSDWYQSYKQEKSDEYWKTNYPGLKHIKPRPHPGRDKYLKDRDDRILKQLGLK